METAINAGLGYLLFRCVWGLLTGYVCPSWEVPRESVEPKPPVTGIPDGHSSPTTAPRSTFVS